MKLYSSLILTVVFLLSFVSPLSAQNGAALLDKAAEAYEKANGISASFALHYQSPQTSESFEGQIQMKGDKFTLVAPGMQMWYDGKTQWRYSNDEVNITEPTGEELQYINPAVLLRTYKKGYEAKYIGESTAPSGKIACDVELKPKKKSDITRISLQIEKISSFPSRIVIEDKNGTRTTIQIDKLTSGVNQPEESFVFNNEQYPDALVIDLR